MASHVDQHVAAYAFGALDGDDRVPVEQHLAECASCAAAARQARQIAALLPYTVTPYQAPADLRGALLDRVQVRSAVHASSGFGSAGTGAASYPWWKTLTLHALPWAAAIAGWAVVIALLSYSHGQTDRIASLQQNEQTRLTTLISATQSLQNIQSYLYTPGVRAAQLLYQAGNAPHTTVMLYYAPGYLHALLTARGLAVLPSSKTYRIWARTAAGTPVPLGRLITSGPRAEGSTVIAAPQPLHQYAVIGLSLEQRATALPSNPILIFKVLLPSRT